MALKLKGDVGRTNSWDVTALEDGVAMNLSGLLNAYFTAKKKITDTDDAAAVQVSLAGGGVTVVDQATGKLRVVVSAERSLTIPDGSFFCDLTLVFAEETITADRGTITFTKSVTNKIS